MTSAAHDPRRRQGGPCGSEDLAWNVRGAGLRTDQETVGRIPAIAGSSHQKPDWLPALLGGNYRVSNAMVNVSVWRSPADARQMDTLAAMRALAGEFVRLGVRFERPIANHEVLWDIESVQA